MREKIGFSRRGFVVALAGAGALSACGATKRVNRPNPGFAPIRFAPGQIPMAVSKVEIVVRPRPNADAAPADADFVVPPEAIARGWPKQRIVATGGQNVLRYVIDDASAISRTADGGEVVVASVQVRMIVRTPYGIEEAGAGARVDSEIRFTGFPSIIERQEALHRLSQDIAAKLDAQLTGSVQRQLSGYVRTAP